MDSNSLKLLQEWHQLLKDGLISEEDFAAKKSDLLGIQKITPEETTAQTHSSGDEHNSLKLLKEMHQLVNEGLIKEEDYNLKKSQLLGIDAHEKELVQMSHTDIEPRASKKRTGLWVAIIFLILIIIALTGYIYWLIYIKYPACLC